MTQDEIIEMAKQAGMIYREFSDEFANGNTDGVDLETMENFAKLVAQHEREACADVADRLPRIYRETKEAHERATLEPFIPSRFGFDFAEMRQAEAITHSIRARGQA
jgi:hypothetical protein